MNERELPWQNRADEYAKDLFLPTQNTLPLARPHHELLGSEGPNLVEEDNRIDLHLLM